MATRLLQRGKCVAFYLPNFGAAVQHFRAFSAYDKWSVKETVNKETPGEVVRLEESLGPFSQHALRFPLPGLVGPSRSMAPPAPPEVDPGAVLPALRQERHAQVSDSFLLSVESHEKSLEMIQKDLPDISPADMLECRAEDCPQLLRKDFCGLFPGRNIMEGNFTLITISHHTEHDMSTWSADVERERDVLLETFIQGAAEICDALHEAGFWADFIDPSSGKPYLGAHTNAALFETDERLRWFGYEVEDLGCCKVIRHHVWGTHAYVGCLFTDAPMSHPVIQAFNAPPHP